MEPQIPKTFPIQPCLWFDGQAQAAAEFYARTFSDAEVLDANPMVVHVRIADQTFMLLNGGPYYQVNPSISFFHHCRTEAEIVSLWNALLDGGESRMPLDTYPFAPKYGWVADKFGVNWQLMLPATEPKQRVFPSLMFTQAACGRSEEALRFYTGLFPGSGLGTLSRYAAGPGPDKEGTLNYAEFSLGGRWFSAMDSAQPHQFGFTEGVSLFLEVETQDEIDHFWDKLLAGGTESQCGWLKDRFGVSWQVVPKILGELMSDPARADRVVKAFLPMKKLLIEPLLRA